MDLLKAKNNTCDDWYPLCKFAAVSPRRRWWSPYRLQRHVKNRILSFFLLLYQEKMRITLIALSFLTIFFSCTNAQNNAPQQTQELTTFILIRHAEKGDDSPSDPSLSVAGQDRAAKLRDMLSGTSIDAILSTPYKRTQQTVRPLAGIKFLGITDYDAQDPEVVSKLAKQYKGKTVVVSGHSNTTPFFVNQLAGTDLEQLDEQEYDKIFVVTFSRLGDGKVTVIQY
jgi:2,3-bisphosphoglycerate-dependent phosphoglycerate mutase